MNNLWHVAGDVFFNRTTKGQSLLHLKQSLQMSGMRLTQRFATLSDSEHNRRVLSHIIGIERWGQRRLKVVLGEPFQRDEYNHYRPARETDWTALKQEFAATRSETAHLIEAIVKSGVSEESTTVEHNAYGQLSVHGWLRYLDLHANLEAKKMR